MAAWIAGVRRANEAEKEERLRRLGDGVAKKVHEAIFEGDDRCAEEGKGKDKYPALSEENLNGMVDSEDEDEFLERIED
ncbi:hypothetical protein DPSP01_003341 [Paraphaeosphaeria sporulosa]